MSWNLFVWFALGAVICWALGAFFAWKEQKAKVYLFTFLGLAIFFAFILGMWISLERPPLRTMGETRLWYSFFLPLAGIIGGAVALVFLFLVLGAICWYVHRASELLTLERAYNRGSRKKDDYLESGTKKDNSILEIRGPGLQMLPINPYRAKEEYVVHTIFPSNGSSLCKGTHTIGYGTTRGYRDGGIPDIDYSYT